MKYAVDAPELSKYQGCYVLVLNNTSRSEVHQTFGIKTPGGPSQPAAAANTHRESSDPTIKGVCINCGGKRVVAVANTGKGALPARARELRGENAVLIHPKRAVSPERHYIPR